MADNTSTSKYHNNIVYDYTVSTSSTRPITAVTTTTSTSYPYDNKDIWTVPYPGISGGKAPSLEFTYKGSTDKQNKPTWVINGELSDETMEYVAKHLKKHLDSVEEKRKAKELAETQRRNKRLRGLIDHVIFSGPVTVVKWADGTITKVRCAEGEPYDAEKGLLAAMAKKLYENTNIFVEELQYWCEPEQDEIQDDDIFEDWIRFND